MGSQQKPTAAEQNIFSLGRILQSLREEDNIDVLVEMTISYIKEQFEYDLIWVALYNRLEHILFGKGGFAPRGDSNFFKQRLVLSPGDLLEQVVIEQRPLGVADLRAERRAQEWQEIANKYNIQGTIILPIRYRDRCLGILLLGCEHWGFSQVADEKARLGIVLGELGMALYHQERNSQYEQTKRPDEVLFGLLDNLRTLSNFEQRLGKLVHYTHDYISPTRTNVYWFEPSGRYFWRRTSSQQSRGFQKNDKLAGAITALELSDFYYALAANELVWIGEARASIKSNFTLTVLERFSVRSILAAPIIWQKELLGFLALESKDSRIWSENDKSFVKAASSLISLVGNSDSQERVIKEIKARGELTNQIAKAIYSDNDIETILNHCGEKVIEKLGVVRFLLLQYDRDQNNYQIFYQSHPQNRKPLTFALDALKDVDWALLQRTDTAVGIENLESDLCFYNWSVPFVELGVRSLLIGNTKQGEAPEALLLVAGENTRAWTVLEKELLWVVSQQLGVIVRQWQLHTSMEQQQQVLYSFQQCLRILEDAQNTNGQTEKNHLERTALQQIASVLNCPLAILLSWKPGERYAEIIPGVIQSNRFEIKSDTTIPIIAEHLVQLALETEGISTLKVEDLPSQTRKWLLGCDIGQVLVMALRTAADFEPTGVVLLADHHQRHWSEQSLNATETLICQLAWSRRWLQVSRKMETKTTQLQKLNWYKHRRLEEIYRNTTQLLGQLHDMGIPRDELSQMRYQQVIRQLDGTKDSMNSLLKNEQWRVNILSEAIPIASLLRRSLERVDNLLKQQKLWVGVHGLGQEVESGSYENNYSLLSQSTLAIVGDITKIELIMYELLQFACYRSVNGGRIDIWCRRLDESVLEISITDNGVIDDRMLVELNQDNPKDVLAPSSLNQPPGLHLIICQNIMQKLKGELNFYKLPDGRVVSRLLLPLASSEIREQGMGNA